jgi:hypothetical protein
MLPHETKHTQSEKHYLCSSSPSTTTNCRACNLQAIICRRQNAVVHPWQVFEAPPKAVSFPRNMFSPIHCRSPPTLIPLTLVFAVMSAPFSTRNRTTGRWPFAAATSSGVAPSCGVHPRVSTRPLRPIRAPPTCDTVCSNCHRQDTQQREFLSESLHLCPGIAIGTPDECADLSPGVPIYSQVMCFDNFWNVFLSVPVQVYNSRVKEKEWLSSSRALKVPILKVNKPGPKKP